MSSTLMDDLQAEFANSPVPCQIVDGKKHKKIFVGPVMAGIIPKNGKDTSDRTRRARMNTLAQVRRAIRRARGE